MILRQSTSVYSRIYMAYLKKIKNKLLKNFMIVLVNEWFKLNDVLAEKKQEFIKQVRPEMLNFICSKESIVKWWVDQKVDDFRQFLQVALNT